MKAEQDNKSSDLDEYTYPCTFRCGMWISAAIVLFIPAVLVWQLIVFLRSGEWTGVSVISGLSGIGVDWASSPKSWYGLHEVLDFLHIGVGLWIVAAVVFWIAFLLSDFSKNRPVGRKGLVMDWKERHRTEVEKSIRFFGNEGKLEREKWVVKQLLSSLRVEFDENDLCEAEEPGDVKFRNALFQVKEIMQYGRRRHDELRRNLTEIELAKSESDLLESYTPQNITFTDVVDHTLARAQELETTKYGPLECAEIDLVCYFNWLDYSIVPPLSFDQVKTVFRSISVVSNTYCAVLAASDSAPDFLIVNKGKVISNTIE